MSTYVPPHVRKRQQANKKPSTLSKDEDRTFQEEYFYETRRKINSLINKINTKNIQDLLPEFFEINLIRARGIFCLIIMKAQLAAPMKYTKLYASLIAVINTKLPENGRLMIIRLIAQFRRGMRLNDKVRSIASVSFLAELINHRVAGEILGLQIAQFLLENPTDASVEVAVEFIKQVGMTLDLVIPKGLHFIFETFRDLLQDGSLSKRVIFQVESLFTVRREKFYRYVAIPAELDLVEESDQVTHEIGLDEPDIVAQKLPELNKFTLDPSFIKNEEIWKKLQDEILDEESESESEVSSVSNDPQEESPMQHTSLNQTDARLISTVNNRGTAEPVKDLTESDLISLRRVIYLTIMSSINFEECCHKILKMKIPSGLEMEVVTMLIDCCSQEKVFEKFFGSLATRLCILSQVYNHCFIESFHQKLDTCHRLETNQLRNVAKLFSFLLFSDAISWAKVCQSIVLSQDDTTSSSRIFIKTLLQDLSENLGLKELKSRLLDKNHQVYKSGIEDWEEMTVATKGMFPKTSVDNARFAVNFLTVIGLGALTDDLREFVQESLLKVRKGAASTSSSSYSYYDSDASIGSAEKSELVQTTSAVAKVKDQQELPAPLKEKLKLINRRRQFIEVKVASKEHSKISKDATTNLKRRKVTRRHRNHH